MVSPSSDWLSRNDLNHTGFSGGRLLSPPVERTDIILRWDRGDHPGTPGGTAQPQAAHKPVRRDPVPVQLLPDLAHPVQSEARIPNAANLVA